MPESAEAPLPLDGIKVVEFQSLAPGPFASMILSDFGADVVLVERPGGNPAGMQLGSPPILSRGKRSVVLDLHRDEDRGVALRLVEHADVLIEGYRPGVMERLGLGPDLLQNSNPGLVYARVTGWGQAGPYAQRMGHDINFVAVGGPLAQIGDKDPVPPSVFVGDLAGGSLMAVIGILLALQARDRTGKGQVVDAAIVDGAAHLMSAHLELHHRQALLPRGDNVMEGRAPYSSAYQCADGRWYTIGAVEPTPYANLLAALELHDEQPDLQDDRSRWPRTRRRIAQVFLKRTRDEWEQHFESWEVSGAPMLSIDELPDHPHTKARGLFPERNGRIEVRPSPLLSETPGRLNAWLAESGEHSAEIRQRLLTDPHRFPSKSSTKDEQ